MEVNLHINNQTLAVTTAPGETLLKLLRRSGYFGVKHGCESGECGACTILLDGKPVNSCLILAAQAEGHDIQTIETLGEHPDQGWRANKGLHPLQQAFVSNGAIQCGYCTPAQILTAKHLLDKNPNPTEDEIRQVLSGVLCRCTGYIKPVQAIQLGAANLRSDHVGTNADESSKIPIGTNPLTNNPDVSLPLVIPVTSGPTFQRVGKPDVKGDA